jgi:cell wall-associated NlpC family hydrolase
MNVSSHDICKAARSWIGTPFKLHGRIKGVGCDCLGLIMGVGEELNLKTKHGIAIKRLDCLNYTLNHDGEHLLVELNRHFNHTIELQPGNLALMSYDGNPQHLAIVADYNKLHFSLIHAHIPCHQVVEHILSKELEMQITRLYLLFN